MIKIANAPCSWGALEFDLEGEAPDYVQVLNEIVETGYAGTELGDWGFMPTDPKKLSQEVHGRNLVLLGAFVPVFLKDPASHQSGIEIDMEPGQSYYVRSGWGEQGFFHGAHKNIMLMMKEQANYEIKQLKPLDDKDVAWGKPNASALK